MPPVESENQSLYNSYWEARYPSHEIPTYRCSIPGEFLEVYKTPRRRYCQNEEPVIWNGLLPGSPGIRFLHSTRPKKRKGLHVYVFASYPQAQYVRPKDEHGNYPAPHDAGVLYIPVPGPWPEEIKPKQGR